MSAGSSQVDPADLNAADRGTCWRIPEQTLEASYAEIAADGMHDREGIALWAGKREVSRPELATVTHVLLLRGSAVTRAKGLITIAPELLNAVTDLLTELGDDVYLIGQIHGHPPNCSTDLSWTDVAYGIRFPEYLSVVVPSYGLHGPRALHDSGVHVFNLRSGWRRLLPGEVHRRIHIDRYSRVRVLTVACDAEPTSTLVATPWLSERRITREDG